MTAPFKRVLMPGCVDAGARTPSRIYVTVEWDGTRLSLTGVIGPRKNGNADGSAGQIEMGFRHRDPADDDSRYRRLTGPDEIDYAPRWDAEMWLDLLATWKRWHLNDMRSACEHQRALGWTYDTHRDPDPDAPGFPYVGLPCPECGYRIGSAWLTEEVPEGVLGWLAALPSSVMPYPWGDR